MMGLGLEHVCYGADVSHCHPRCSIFLILHVLRVAHDKIDEGHTRGKIVLSIDL